MRLEPACDVNRLPAESNTRTSSRIGVARRCLQLALLLCLIGLVPTSLAIWGERRAAAATAWRNPADDTHPAAIAPDLALLSLAGVPDDQVLALAMEASELETVRALLAFSADLTDQQRMNGWLWLAYRYQKAEQRGRATQAYRLTGGGAVLSGHLPDLLRTETLLTVGRQLIALHDEPGARYYLRQAALIGAHAPHLTDYYRRRLLERLIPTSLRAGGKRDDWIALARTVKSGTARGGSVAFTWHDATPGEDAALVAARDARRAAAATLLAGGAASDRDRQALRQALLNEDAAADEYLKRTLAMPASTREVGLAAQETWLHWLLFKRRIAAGGAGAGLVPEWESSREQINAALTVAWADWLTLYTNPTDADPMSGGQTLVNSAEPRLAASASRRAIVAAYWGLYPDASVADLVPVAQGLSSPGGLRLIIIKPGTPPLVGWSE
jgi:hypothetical protein